MLTLDLVDQLLVLGVGDVDHRSRFGPLDRSEEHTSELQSLVNLVSRLLLEKKKLVHFKSLKRRLGIFVVASGVVMGMVVLDDILEALVGHFTSRHGHRALNSPRLPSTHALSSYAVFFLIL